MVDEKKKNFELKTKINEIIAEKKNLINSNKSLEIESDHLLKENKNLREIIIGEKSNIWCF